ncbi:hypothetical protein [Streptomyces triticirhizae]|uniref:hypothetical protein n=1 Tax=Streptomyces triticirhizae TaxID=2483353 RepID=UPI0011C39311|nr:hypothetical protein [Streptomyces triticirhizae]
MNRLVLIGATALDDGRGEVRIIGERLNKAGGVDMMVVALHHADALSQEIGNGYILRMVERAWDGIGEWRG